MSEELVVELTDISPTIEVNMTDASSTIEIAMTETGASGREVELQKTSDYIQWRYVGETEWQDLFPLSDLVDHYVLPTATSDVLGGIKVGSKLAIADSVLSIDSSIPNESLSNIEIENLINSFV